MCLNLSIKQDIKATVLMIIFKKTDRNVLLNSLNLIVWAVLLTITFNIIVKFK